MSEWWENADSLDSATPVTVTAGSTFTANAALDRPAPSLTGKITDAATGLPVDSGNTEVYRWIEEQGYWDYWDSVHANSNGDWQVFGLPAGTYSVSCYGSDYDEATGNYTDYYSKDLGEFTLEEGGTITGLDAALVLPKPAAPDEFEPDNSISDARLVSPDGSTELHSTYPEGDTD